MKREAVKEVMATVYDDISEIRIMDGTGTLGHSKNVCEVIVGDTLYYASYVGRVNKKDFPDLKSGEIRDSETIEKIKQKLY